MEARGRLPGSPHRFYEFADLALNTLVFKVWVEVKFEVRKCVLIHWKR